MSIWDNVGKIAGGVTGGIAGLPAGIFGVGAGGYAGSKIGNTVQRGVFGYPYEPFDYSGMATYPTYIGMEPGELSISGEFGGPNAPLKKFSEESMRTGLSPATDLALQENQRGANFGRDQARRMASGMAKNAEASLAMTGGLNAGARERIGKYSTDVGMDAAQAADAAAGKNRANLLISDEAARTGNLAQASGLVTNDRQQKYNFMAGDLDRRQKELDRRNLYNMNLYNQNMQAWAAGKQADATAKSGDGGKI